MHAASIFSMLPPLTRTMTYVTCVCLVAVQEKQLEAKHAMAVHCHTILACVQPHAHEVCYVCRKALHLLRHVIQAHPPDAAAACQLGAAQQAATCLASSDSDTWQAALLLIQQLTQNTETLGQLKQVSQ